MKMAIFSLLYPPPITQDVDLLSLWLQAQLAEKTTLLSEARLKEQEFVERVSVQPSVGLPKSSIFPETCGLWQKRLLLYCCIDFYLHNTSVYIWFNPIKNLNTTSRSFHFSTDLP